ncbi:MAG: M20/M25/M40 family metallo-hydrolase [Oscillospiraceae bacterium]|jgi:carboxypeptidase PM20D1|nr:M20/M25/M40 family metallo-hydrolase [Oscillospiraceae bacterium]
MPDMFWWLAVPLASLLLTSAAVYLLAAPLRIKHRAAAPPKDPQVNASLAAHAADSLSAAIAFQTVSNKDDSNRSYGEWVRLREYLKQRYPLVHRTLDREQFGGFSLLYRWRAADPKYPPLLFCGHIDVAPAHEGWTRQPFGGEIAGGCVWGRGAIDCKSVVVCLLEAAEHLLSEGFEPQRDIFLAFGHDEELGGEQGAKNIAKAFVQADMKFDMVLDEGGCLSRAPLPIGRPAAHVCVAEKGRASLRFTAKDENPQAAVPPKQSALGRLCEAVCRLEYKPVKSRLTPVVRDMLKALAPELPLGRRILICHPFLFRGKLLKEMEKHRETNALVRTTVAPTMAKGSHSPGKMPETAEFLLNARLLVGENENAFAQYMAELTQDLGVEVEIMSVKNPSAVSKYNTQSFASVRRAIEHVFGPVPVLPSVMASGTDAAHYERFSECVYRFTPFVLTPEELAGIHGPDEHIKVQALGSAVLFYEELMRGV